MSTEAWRVSNLLEVKQLLTQKAFRILCRCEGLTACHGGHPPCGGPECADQGGQQRSWVAFAQKQAFALVEESMSLEEESMRSKLLNVEAVTPPASFSRIQLTLSQAAAAQQLAEIQEAGWAAARSHRWRLQHFRKEKVSIPR